MATASLNQGSGGRITSAGAQAKEVVSHASWPGHHRPCTVQLLCSLHQWALPGLHQWAMPRLGLLISLKFTEVGWHPASVRAVPCCRGVKELMWCPRVLAHTHNDVSSGMGTLQEVSALFTAGPQRLAGDFMRKGLWNSCNLRKDRVSLCYHTSLRDYVHPSCFCCCASREMLLMASSRSSFCCFIFWGRSNMDKSVMKESLCRAVSH